MRVIKMLEVKPKVRRMAHVVRNFMDNLSDEEKALFDLFMKKARDAFPEEGDVLEVYEGNKREIFGPDPIKQVFAGKVKWKHTVISKYNFPLDPMLEDEEVREKILEL